MQFKHQEAGDAAYLPNLFDIPKITAMINLDFDKDGRLVGIEFIGARDVLPREMFG